jgi:hypothetical protein
MKKIIAICACLLSANICLATEFRLKVTNRGNFKIEFPNWSVNGVTAWSNAEKNALVTQFNQFSATSPVVLLPITPTEFEVNLSTCMLDIVTADEFAQALTKDGMIHVLEALNLRLLAYQTAGMNQKATDIQQRLNYLGSVAKTLP